MRAQQPPMLPPGAGPLPTPNYLSPSPEVPFHIHGKKNFSVPFPFHLHLHSCTCFLPS